ncbi:MAG TPA: putative nucleotidyltransferase substrate binding domain-containing protein [Solirubrobacteraceae bacterium]|jgi:CBS domain-containing protein|nr:putative nucleotidyltransferase substrate binding domain-containing protein [Solirubrobacteraceae bacterium]
MDDLDTFLAGHPPFDALASGQLRELTAQAAVCDYEPGAVLLVEDGPPATGLGVVVTGSMDVVHSGEVIQVLEPGECFGHPSLLTGMAPAFTVRAREPSRCALFPPGAARRVLATEAGVAYVAGSLRKRLTRAGHTVHGLHDVGTTPVSAVMRAPVYAEPAETLRSAAQRLGKDHVQALLVAMPDETVGILTDADVRAAVADGHFSADLPAQELARSPAPTVPLRQLAIEATVDMLAAGVEHMAVLDSGRVCGVLSAADLLGLDANSPIGLRHTILGAPDADVLVQAVSHLPQLFLTLSRAGVPSRDLGRVLTLAHDAVVARLIDFSLWTHGPAPLPWAWLDMGSAGRREFTLASDQDNALAYARPAPGAQLTPEAADAYFERLGQDVNEGLERCGIGLDNNGVMARNRRWRMSKPDWLRIFDECLTQPDESHLVRATVAFDFRPAAGGLAVVSDLSARIRSAREHPQFMRLLARSASGFPVALGFRGQLSTDGDGHLDLKKGAIIPVVNLVRYHALAAGVTISPTLDRIEAVAMAGALEADEASALSEAFEVIARMRFEHHAQLISEGHPAGNLIDPGALTPIARTELREALQVVKRAQKRLSV